MSNRLANRIVCNVGSEGIPEISKAKILAALKQMQIKKCPGKDKITCQMLNNGGQAITKSP